MTQKIVSGRLIAATLSLCLFAVGCDNMTAPPIDEGERPTVLASLGNKVFTPAFESFQSDAAALKTTLASYAADTSMSNRDAARTAWRQAMMSWQKIEMMQVGALGEMGDVIGGQGLRNEVYAWPAKNRCPVDEVIATKDSYTIEDIGAFLIDARGLLIMEDLLFNEDLGHACAALNPINAPWQAFSEQELTLRRARMAATMADFIKLRADDIINAWQGTFLAAFTSPRSGPYGTAQEGLNAVSDALFYLDTEIKDMKIGTPTGITCTQGAACVDGRESTLANMSLEHMQANLRAFEEIYLGGDEPDALGFDDLLVDMNAADFAETMRAHIRAARDAGDVVTKPLKDSAGTPEAKAYYEAIRLVSDDLKTMFLSILDLEKADRAAGDND